MRYYSEPREDCPHLETTTTMQKMWSMISTFGFARYAGGNPIHQYTAARPPNCPPNIASIQTCMLMQGSLNIIPVSLLIVLDNILFKSQEKVIYGSQYICYVIVMMIVTMSHTLNTVDNVK